MRNHVSLREKSIVRQGFPAPFLKNSVSKMAGGSRHRVAPVHPVWLKNRRVTFVLQTVMVVWQHRTE
jgi:hypothetical protein